MTFTGENVISTGKGVGPGKVVRKVGFQAISVVLWISLGACEGTPCRSVDLGIQII